MFREIILPIFRSTRLCVTFCCIMHRQCCRPVAGTSSVHYTTNCNTQYILQCHKSPPSLPIPDEISAVHVLHPTYWRSILILPFQICVWVSSGHFLSGFPTKKLYAIPLSVSYMPQVMPLQIFLILSLAWHLLTVTKYESPYDTNYPVSSFLVPLKPKYTPSALFLEALCLCSSPVVKNQVLTY